MLKGISIGNTKMVRKRRRQTLEVASNAIDKLEPYLRLS